MRFVQILKNIILRFLCFFENENFAAHEAHFADFSRFELRKLYLIDSNVSIFENRHASALSLHPTTVLSLIAREEAHEVPLVKLVELGQQLATQAVAAIRNDAHPGRDGVEQGLVELRHEGPLLLGHGGLVNVEQVHQGLDGRAL